MKKEQDLPIKEKKGKIDDIIKDDKDKDDNRANKKNIDNITTTNNNDNNINRNVTNNKYNKELNLLIKNRIDLTRKTKINRTEVLTSNWNKSSGYKLNTHSNDNYLFKNQFLKSTPLRDRLVSDPNRNNGIILPDIKTPILKLNRDHLNLNTEANLKNNMASNFLKQPKDMNLNNNKNIKLSTNSNYINDNTQATTMATNSTKKFSTSKMNNIQSINGDLSQYGMGLISTTSTANTNIIIPMLTMRRPASNFNTGGEILYNFNKNEPNINIIKNNENIDNNNEIFKLGFSKNTRNKNCKSQEMKGRSMKNKELYNIFNGLSKMMPNFHKIKIEKGMPHIKFGYSSKQYLDILITNNKVLNIIDNNDTNESYNIANTNLEILVLM